MADKFPDEKHESITLPPAAAATTITTPLTVTIKTPPHVLHVCLVNHTNIAELRSLNDQIFPVCYNEVFYQKICAASQSMPSASFLKLGTLQGQAIGAVCCRIESLCPSPSAMSSLVLAAATTVHPLPPPPHKLYIMTLGVLPAFRHQKFGTYMRLDGIDVCLLTWEFV